MSQRAIVNTHTHTQGGIEAVVTAMRCHAESSKLQEAACGALNNLASNHPENQQRIKRAGAGKVVERVISAPGVMADTNNLGQFLLDALKKV